MYVRPSVRLCDIMLKRPAKELKRENLSKEASKQAGKQASRRVSRQARIGRHSVGALEGLVSEEKCKLIS